MPENPETPKIKAASDTVEDIAVELIHLVRTDLHEREKPYKLQYDPGNGIPRSNCTNQIYDSIIVRDLRACRESLSFDVNGFTVLDMESKLKSSEFYDEARVKDVYYMELKDLLCQFFDSSRVEILEHSIRKRHPQFPVSTGEDYEFLQPTSVVHTDFTEKSALEASRDVLKVDNEAYSRIMCVNVWKPLHGPVIDWPLGLCDVKSVNKERDFVASDVVSRTGYTENYLVYYNPEHRWYYLRNQTASELVLFGQTDNQSDSFIGVPHAGFEAPHSASQAKPRESIEARAFIYYE